MSAAELLRLVIINISQNKLKTIMTSIGIVVGAATIVMVIAIGRGGQMDVAEQFAGLNAGAIDVTYEYKGDESGSSGGFSFGNFFGNIFGQGRGQNGAGSRAANAGSPAGGSSGDGGGGGNFTPPSGGGGGTAGVQPSGNGGGMAGTQPSGNGGGSADAQPSGNGGGGVTPPSGNDQGGSFTPPGMGDGTDMTPPTGLNRDDLPGSGNNGSEEIGERMTESDDENQAGDGEGDEEAADLTDERMNQEMIRLTAADVDDIELYASDISGATITYTVRADVEGAQLTQAQSYTIAGAREDYLSYGNLDMAAGTWFEQADDDVASRVCVLGASVAKELFGSAQDAQDEKLYLDDRVYTVLGVLESSQAVFAGISPDEVIFVPFETGIKYIAGSEADTTITVITDDVDHVSRVEEEIQQILQEKYPDAEFSFSDAGSKMEAAEKSNRILTMLLSAMAAIVFLVGGIGIMNVLFVSVRERTNEIGVLKALGASRKMILTEFLLESAAISSIGGLLGIGVSLILAPVIEHYGMRVETTAAAYGAALGFAVLTGTLFGFYPAWKASRLIPVEALNAE